jgi:hypothetical protein
MSLKKWRNIDMKRINFNKIIKLIDNANIEKIVNYSWNSFKIGNVEFTRSGIGEHELMRSYMINGAMLKLTVLQKYKLNKKFRKIYNTIRSNEIIEKGKRNQEKIEKIIDEITLEEDEKNSNIGKLSICTEDGKLSIVK